MPLASSPANAPRMAEVVRTEENGSDVNLASLMLRDAFAADYELAVIVSNDSDLLMPIEIVRKELNLQVGVLNPNQRISNAPRRVATFYRPIQPTSLAASQFPPMLADGHGKITKPAGW